MPALGARDTVFILLHGNAKVSMPHGNPVMKKVCTICTYKVLHKNRPHSTKVKLNFLAIVIKWIEKVTDFEKILKEPST